MDTYLKHPTYPKKSKGFWANCFDKDSKLFLQLLNGTIVTLIHIDQENCGTNDKGWTVLITEWWQDLLCFWKGVLKS
jgi:hypothetical protein